MTLADIEAFLLMTGVFVGISWFIAWNQERTEKKRKQERRNRWLKRKDRK